MHSRSNDVNRLVLVKGGGMKTRSCTSGNVIEFVFVGGESIVAKRIVCSSIHGVAIVGIVERVRGRGKFKALAYAILLLTSSRADRYSITS